MSRPTTQAAWLAYLETLHPKSIAMGLDRVAAVHACLAAKLTCPVVTVTGTNGKGSTCAIAEAILRAAGFRVGLYTSPHLLRYNERVRIAGREVPDDDLVDAFNAVEDARIAAAATGAPVQLTYFEFGTLAALWLFARSALDAVILEVGLGGRLDAVNIVDADVAVVTSVDLDHMDYLGPTREDIAREKAGVFRPKAPVVCAEPSPPAPLLERAAEIDAPVSLIGRDYGYVGEGAQWQYWGPGGRRYGLPHPALRGSHQLANAATAITALELLRDRVAIDGGAVRAGLMNVQLPGRFQVLAGRPTVVVDVAHNPHAARVLAAAVGSMGFHTQTFAVFAMLGDKDIAGVIAAIASRIDRWYIAPLPGPRGASAATIRATLASAGIAEGAIREHHDVEQAFDAARGDADDADRIIVFGSFLTVAATLAAIERGARRASRHG